MHTYFKNPYRSLTGILLMLCALCSLSCGYTAKSTLPGHLKAIHIEPFKNEIDFTTEQRRNIYLPLLEVDVRNAVVDRYLLDGNLKVAESHAADLVLSGKLISYHRGALRYFANDDVEEYRVYVTVSLQLWDTHKEEYAWSEPRFVGEGTYFVSGSQASSEESAVEAAIEDLARRVVERTVENW